MRDTLFGSAIRTDSLVAIARLQRTYVSELANLLQRRVIEVQRVIVSLERAQVVVSTRLGSTRILELNPTFPAKDELYALLLRLSEMPQYMRLWPKTSAPTARNR